MPQAPFVAAPFAVEQASQAPSQALSQQKPSTQRLLRHWFVAEQLAPCAPLGTQWLFASQ
jgi:hypothetical protein